MFLIIVFGLLAAVMFGALRAVPLVFPGIWAARARHLALALDVFTLVMLAAMPLLFHEAYGAIGALLQAAIISFVVQAFFAGGTLLFFVWQYLAGLRGSMRLRYDAGRRRLLRHAVVVPCAALAGGLYGGLYEKEATVEREVQIPVKDLPLSLRGFRIAQLSDVHLGFFYTVEDLKALLARTAAGRPDVLVLTGDIFDSERMNPEAMRLVDSYVEAFPQGIWYCHGNHEHHHGIERIEHQLAETRIHVLVNRAETVVEASGGDGRPLVFAGVDYPMYHDAEHFVPEERAFSEQAMGSLPENAVTVLLTHHPDFFDDAAARGINLALAGHTHGCQFGILGHPVIPAFKYNRGLVKIGGTLGYVHSGNGSWFPVRIGCPPEIAYFTLRRA